MAHRTPPEQRQKILSRFRHSGLTQREFSAREGIQLATLQAWLYRPPANAEGRPRFVELAPVDVKATHGAIEIRVGEVRVVLPAGLDDTRVVAIVSGLAREVGRVS